MESALVLPDGESGNVTTSTCDCLSIWAASSSFWSLSSTGGASSTAISLCAPVFSEATASPSRRPLRKLSFEVLPDCCFSTCILAVLTILPISTRAVICFIYSGFVPQQPPIISIPSAAISWILSTNPSLLSLNTSLLCVNFGYPAFGIIDTGFPQSTSSFFRS